MLKNDCFKGWYFKCCARLLQPAGNIARPDLSQSDYSAGDFFAGISRGLGCKVIGIRVDYHGFADDFTYGKSIGQKCAEGCAACTEKGRHIPGMMRMRTTFGIKVRHCVFKIICAVTCTLETAVNMIAQYRAFAFILRNRQTVYKADNNRA